MKKEIRSLNILIEAIGEEWKQTLDSYLKDREKDFSEETELIISDFLDVCREAIISNNTQDLKLIEKKINNDLLYHNLYNYIKESLNAYYLAAPLRALAVKDAGKTEKVVCDIFNQVILRFNPEILNVPENLGFADQEALISFLNMFDSFCSFIAERNFCYTAIENVVYNTFRFSKKMCTQISKIIDDNFQQIRMNYIIDRLKEFD